MYGLVLKKQKLFLKQFKTLNEKGEVLKEK